MYEKTDKQTHIRADPLAQISVGPPCGWVESEVIAREKIPPLRLQY